MPTERIEDYLEAIQLITTKKGYARGKDVAELLGISPSSVTEMFQKLSKKGYINYEKYSGVTLTDKGRRIAIKTQRIHDTLERFLLILGLDENIAKEDACRIEHVLNPETIDRLTKFVEFVQQLEGSPLWLHRFKHYYETGEYIHCDRRKERRNLK
ncbi:MAG TPA: metal-dependent transcriptional regulator [Thermoplasmatales archaeon]|nr:metal-dependent transcriptional regulator [Thermoplasmatales archaeon]